ncbi:hypothetical protein [Streptomyces sp. 1114.5]|uniref:hypothetical protein n=1 Tax=Streptomyces sp. 1114.5 TaxID=1938830 RepID=UPI000EB51353|nr:hypothetical protein [Streptomyces sp. 1114.5]
MVHASAAAEALRRDRELWQPGVPLVEIPGGHRRLGPPIAAFVNELGAEHAYDRLTVLIPEVEPARRWQQALQKRCRTAAEPARRRDRPRPAPHTDAVVCRLRLRLRM